jgi:hypothetical protein
MPLTLRPTGLSSPAYRDWLDYVVIQDDRAVGRIYEDRHTPPDLGARNAIPTNARNIGITSKANYGLNIPCSPNVRCQRLVRLRSNTLHERGHYGLPAMC